MYIDTHTHLNFEAFQEERFLAEVIGRASEASVTSMVVVGTTPQNSLRATTLSQRYDSLYAAVGIHPHHVFRYFVLQPDQREAAINNAIDSLDALLHSSKVVAVGEVGFDRHQYLHTHYKGYQVTDDFVELQAEILNVQAELAWKHRKPLIIHNREAANDLLIWMAAVEESKPGLLKGRAVLHCCESDERLLDFARINQLYIGVDADVLTDQKKREFIAKVPLSMLVLETDAPFFPLADREQSEPADVKVVAEQIALLKGIDVQEVAQVTTANSETLFFS